MKSNQTLYELLKKCMNGGRLGPLTSIKQGYHSSNIGEYIWIIIIVCLIFVFGPILYNYLNTMEHLLDAGGKGAGMALNFIGELMESETYCLGSKMPKQTCDPTKIESIKTKFGGLGGFNICSSCNPPCLIEKINCTKYILGTIGIASSVFLYFFGTSMLSLITTISTWAYCKATCVKDPKKELEDAADRARVVTENGENPIGDPKAEKKQIAEEKRSEADRKRTEADKLIKEFAAIDKSDSAMVKEAAQKAATDAENAAKEADAEADEAKREAEAEAEHSGDAGGEGGGGGGK
tara:strand:+ start:1183 stop:2064 length:882 start_codon:yes stop_codon:yes gene_type:complete